MSSRRTMSLQDLRPGVKVDIQDQEGDWFETLIRKVIGTKIVCHFWGFANIWDCTIEFDASKVAPVYSFSEKSKYNDNEKLLGECVWEILSIKRMLNEKKQCTAESFQLIQRDTGISRQQMQSFLDTMDAPDAIVEYFCFLIFPNLRRIRNSSQFNVDVDVLPHVEKLELISTL